MTRDSVRAYRLGLLTFWASMTVSGILLVQDSRIATSGLPVPVLVTVLRTVELVAGVVLAFAGLLIPRRPAVFYEDGGAVKKQAQLRPVDAQYTESAISRFNFSWISPLLAVATRKNDLDLNDLPRVDHYRRARDVSAAWRRQGFKGPLWLDVIRAHKWTFALQWGLTLMSSVLQFMPQWVVLQLLRILERRRPGDKIGPDAWIWVIWLGVVLVIRNWVESYMFWLSLVDATIPVRAQLSALIFEKSMRRKDVKGTGKTTKKAGEAAAEDGTQDGAANVKTAKTGKKEEEEEEDEAEALKKSKQSTVNLIGVDADRVANFCSYNNLYPASVFNLVVALTFLVSLLGWIPLVAGFSTMLAIMPLNIWASKRYAAAQDRLMKVRDQKTGVVTEALQGIRQIKFAALEPQWERKIGAIREKELQCVWDVFTFDTVLIGCWILSPLFLAAVSLATYAIIHGSLIPSVAFVSLGIFKGLEMTLAVVPELTTDLLDAWVSLKRMDDYLKSPEIEKLSKEADEIIFDDVSLAWPADEKTPEEERFVLRNVSVAFPTGELSVISGKTGSGKTLMLAAILGEADVLSGTLMMPRPPPIHERFDSKATKADWIIPGAIAYVAQIPWIENASIKDNILFGLPYDEDRYVACLDVCALRKDLDMLPDGENTEIGANGINLSGGQRWRVTLARAVYSRAGILVLDDIFSAVDAHVGRHIFERCLTGELCRGRTRILVTHHVALCEPRTRYLVELGDGHVLNAGLLSDLQEAGALERIRSHAKADVEAEEGGGDVTAVNSEGGSDAEDNEDASPNGNTLSKVASRASAKKFVEEETREKGAVKKHIYATYMRDSGSWPFWTFAVILFITVQVLTIGKRP